MVRLFINDRAITASPGQTVLEAANAVGIIIPTLCYHRSLMSVGSCRLCLMEVEGRTSEAPSCTLPAAEGIVFGNFHFPAEHNINSVTNRALDPVAKIPEYKVCAVRIEPLLSPF